MENANAEQLQLAWLLVPCHIFIIPRILMYRDNAVGRDCTKSFLDWDFDQIH